MSFLKSVGKFIFDPLVTFQMGLDALKESHVKSYAGSDVAARSAVLHARETLPEEEQVPLEIEEKIRTFIHSLRSPVDASKILFKIASLNEGANFNALAKRSLVKDGFGIIEFEQSFINEIAIQFTRKHQSIIAHELGHLVHDDMHTGNIRIKRITSLSKTVAYGVSFFVMSHFFKAGLMRSHLIGCAASNIADTIIHRKIHREQEFDADRFAAEQSPQLALGGIEGFLAEKNTLTVESVRDLLPDYQWLKQKAPAIQKLIMNNEEWIRFWLTHPSPNSRIRAVVVALQKLGTLSIVLQSARSDNRSNPVAEAILQAGADVNLACHRGYTPLHTATYCNDVVTLDIFVRAGANPNTQNDLQECPLDASLAMRNPQTVSLLMKARNIDLISPDKDGNSPLHKAAADRAIPAEITTTLLQHNANINARDRAQNIPLHVALRSKHFQVAESLIKSKADLTARNLKGETPAKVAIETRQIRMIEILSSHGADFSYEALFDSVELADARATFTNPGELDEFLCSDSDVAKAVALAQQSKTSLVFNYMH